MNSQNFYTLPPDEQLAELEALAREELENWGLECANLRLLKYRENCVFAV